MAGYAEIGALAGCSVSREYDELIDGIDTIEHLQYNDHAMLLSSDKDTDMDGRVDLAIRHKFEADSPYIIQRVVDDDVRSPIGEPDVEFRYYYDDGLLVQIDTIEGGGTIADEKQHIAYDAAGNWVAYERDKDADGIADERESYFYDGGGRRVRAEIDVDADEVLNRIHDYRWLEGKLILELDDLDADGIPEDATAHYFDSRGRHVRSEWDIGRDGHTDHSTKYFYDRAGWLIRIETYVASTLETARDIKRDARGRILTEKGCQHGYGCALSISTNRCP